MTRTTNSYPLTDDREWTGVSKRSPCPKCKGHSWCQVTTDGNECMCRRKGDGAYKTGTDARGETYHLHRLKDEPEPSGKGRKRKAKKAPSGTLIELADVDTLHAVYTAMLEDHLGLAARHREDLQRRGFPELDADRLLYRSMEPRAHGPVSSCMAKRFGQETLLSVPGFFVNDQGNLSMACLPGMLIPVRDRDHRIVALKQRPDRSISDGAKYLFVSSKSHGGPGPGAPAHIPLGSPAQAETWRLTEGEVKADLAWILSGLPTVSMSGVSSWRTAVAALETLGCRTVRLAFDADAWTTSEVAEALVACHAALMAKGVEVEMERWPITFGDKPIKGVDDALAAGAPIEILKGDEVKAAIAEAAKLAPNAGKTDDSPGERRIEGIRERIKTLAEGNDAEPLMRDETLLKDLLWLQSHDAGEFGAIKCTLKRLKNFGSRDFDRALKAHQPKKRQDSTSTGKYEYMDTGEVMLVKIACDEGGFTVEILSRFSARITEAITYDDGTETRRALKVVATVQGDPISRTVEVAASEYDEMAWVLAKLGPDAVIWPGRGIRDYLRHGIQELSLPIAERVVYRHTGWREIGGAWKYLHAGGAIGADGLDTSASVELDEDLRGFELPPPLEGDDLKRVVRRAFGLLKFGQEDRPSSRSLAAVAMALPYRAAISPTNYSIQFKGPTGTHKSSTAALIQQHFGRTLGLNALPVSWEGTANAIEATLHQLKDTLAVIDDFVPTGSANEVAHLHKEAERIVRSQGNGQGRRRLNANRTTEAVKRLRGSILTTGEDKLRRRSANARTLPVPFVQDDPKAGISGTVDREVLTACQEAADSGVYAAALAGFVQWLAPRYEEVRSTLPKRALEMRPLATRPGDHARTPDIVADLIAGFDVFLEFAVEIGALDTAKAQKAREIVWDGLMEAAAEARADQHDEGDPATRYLELLVAALNSTKAYLGDYTTGDAPDGMESACGWHQEMKYVGEGNVVPVWTPGPNTPRIGWINSEVIFLEPDAAYNAAMQMIRQQGDSLPSKAELHLQLFNNKKLVRTDSRNAKEGRGRLTSRESIERSRKSVLVLRTKDFWPPGQNDDPSQEVPVGEGTELF